MNGPRLPDAPKAGVMTYGDYLKVPELLQLQVMKSDPPHHDELLFIIIHQAYELWFKLILHEMEVSMEQMNADRVLRAHHFMRRVARIQELLLEQIHILETMSPAEFGEFRDNLRPASGFQSLQFREIEFLAGLRDEAYLKFFKDRPELRDRLQARMTGPTLWDAFAALVKRRFPDRDLLDALAHIYEGQHDHLEFYLLCEALLDFDTNLALWRFHHVQVVERIIGGKPGTGGSDGVAYLRSTVDKKVFPLLWEVRSHITGNAEGAGCPYHAGTAS